MTPEQIYAIAHLDLDAVLQNARENKRDFPQLVAALVTWVDPSDVTHTDRTMVKWVLFGWTYGVSGEEALDRLRAAGFG